MNRTVEYLGETSMNEFPDPRPTFLIPNFFFVLNDDVTAHCKMKSYQYSLLTSHLYFQLHEYDKSFGYLKYSSEAEVKSLMTMTMHRNYFLEMKKLLVSWISLCQQYQDDISHAGGGVRWSSTNFLPMTSQQQMLRQRTSVTALLEKHIQVCCLLREYEGVDDTV
jgi:hypothetical protein